MSPRRGPKRLCILTPYQTDQPGGSEYQIQCLLNELIPQKRYEIYYLAAVVAGTPPHAGYRIVRIGHSPRMPRFGYVTHMPALYRMLSKLAPDVIYQRVGCGYTGIAAHFAQRHGTRLVWHVSSDTDVTPDESLDGRNPVRRFLEKRCVEYGIRRASCIVAQTNHQGRLLELNYQRKPDAIIANFHPEPSEPLDKSGPLTVAWVSSLKPFKQPEAFLDLADSMRDRPEVRFVMMGPWQGEPRWIESLRPRMQATANFEFLGARTQAEVNALLARSHVFVNTSRYEGFPNTFIQAWMREAVVVSLHVDPDSLLEQGLGRFCHGSRQELNTSVRQLLSDAALRNQLAQRAREHARSMHSLANVHSLVELLEAA
ncbi:MAG TPA: glycosyltransferase [Steroidobacteraceae bacterium]